MNDHEKVKGRQADARRQKAALSNALARVVNNDNGLNALSEILTHAQAMPTFKEQVVGAAVQSNVLIGSELTGIHVKPTREQFGNPEENYRTPVERLWRDGHLNGWMATVLFAGLYGIGYLITGSGLDAFGAGVMLWLAFGVGCVGLDKLWKKHSAAYQAFDGYRTAMKRYEVTKLAREIILKSNSAASLYEASGPEFEVRVARIFRKWGYTVTECGGSNDGGVDLIVTQGDEHSLVQCKAHAKAIGPAVARELFGALSHSSANHAYLATLHGVSASAAEFVRGKPMTILTSHDLVHDIAPARAGSKHTGDVKGAAR